MPLAARLLERLIRPHRTFLARTADGKFHRHDRQTEDEQEQHITHDERAAAVLTDHPWELPYVAHADGAACGKQDEAEARAESFSWHCLFFPFFLCRLYQASETHDLLSYSNLDNYCYHSASETADFSILRISFRFLRSSRKKFRRMSAHSCSSTPLTNAG